MWKKVMIPLLLALAVALLPACGSAAPEYSVTAWLEGKKATVSDEAALCARMEEYALSIDTLLNQTIDDGEIERYKREGLCILLSYGEKQELDMAGYSPVYADAIYALEGDQNLLVVSFQDDSARDTKIVFALEESQLTDLRALLEI